MGAPMPILAVITSEQHEAARRVAADAYMAWVSQGRDPGVVLPLLKQVAARAVEASDTARREWVTHVLADPDFDPFPDETPASRELVGAR